MSLAASSAWSRRTAGASMATPRFLAVTALNGVAGYYVPDHSGILSLHGTIPAPLADLVGDPISGNIIEDPWGSPCLELISAARGANSFAMVDVCTRAANTLEPSWRTPGVESTILLDPPARST